MRKRIGKAAVAMVSAVLTALGLSSCDITGGTFHQPKVYGPPPMEYQDSTENASNNIQESDDSLKTVSENEKGNN
ncbi:MAG: hypothetical protein VZR36_03375 [Prevotella sp.]|jgi:hypothetical protein|nr:hypothetical protein [Prevotella sp.]